MDELTKQGLIWEIIEMKPARDMRLKRRYKFQVADALN